MVFCNLAEAVPHPVQFAVGTAGVGTAAQGIVAVLAGDRFAVFALAGLGQYPPGRVPLCALSPEARVFPVDDVPGGVVLTVKAVDKLDNSQQGSEKLNSEYPLSAQDEQNSFLWTQLCRSSAQRMRHPLSGVTVRARTSFYLAKAPK